MSERDGQLRSTIAAGIAAGHSLSELRDALVIFRDAGGSSERALAILEELRSLETDEAREEALLDVMDLASGWGGPHVKVW